MSIRPKPVTRIRGVIDIAVELFGEKLGEGPVGEIEGIPATHGEQVFKEEQIDGTNVWHT